MTVLAIIGFVVTFGTLCVWLLGAAAARGDREMERALAEHRARKNTRPHGSVERHGLLVQMPPSAPSNVAVDRVARFLEWGLLGAHHEPGTASDEATARAVAVLRIARETTDA